jgi:hypothetical protein
MFRCGVASGACQIRGTRERFGPPLACWLTVLRLFRNDVPNVVLGCCTEYVPEALGPLFSLFTETLAIVIGLFSVSNEVDGRVAGSNDSCGRRQDGE